VNLLATNDLIRQPAANHIDDASLSFAKTGADRFVVKRVTCFASLPTLSAVSQGCVLPIHGEACMHHHLRVLKGMDWAWRFTGSETVPWKQQSYAARLSYRW